MSNTKMNRFFLIIFMFLCPAYANAEPEKGVLWNDKKTAVAFCTLEKSTTSCYIVDGNKVTNVSHLENINIGSIGTTPKNKYEKVISYPTKWVESKNNKHIVTFTTNAWLEKQRYTVTKPVLVSNGKYKIR